MSEKAMFKSLFLRKNKAGKTEKRRRKGCGKISGKKEPWRKSVGHWSKTGFAAFPQPVSGYF